MLGAIFIGLVQNGMNLARIESYLQIVVIGVLLILAVIADQLRQKMMAKLAGIDGRTEWHWRSTATWARASASTSAATTRASCPTSRIANVACGFHASDPTVMRKTVRLAKQHGVKVGAHPSLPDLQGFGRREMKMGRDELTDCLIYQVGALKAFLDAEGMTLNHIKPHGALYGMAARSEEVAQRDLRRGRRLRRAAARHGRHQARGGLHQARLHSSSPEYYVDLDYDETGKLIITREHDAVDPDAAAERTLRAITREAR